MSSIGRIVRKNHSAVFWCTRHYPKAKREAVYTLYALVKHFDDLSSSSLPAEEKAEVLEAWKREISNIYDKKVPATNIGRRIYKNCMRFKLKRESFETILNSFAMDCPTPLFRPSMEIFENYCAGVSEIPSYLILKIIAEFDEETTLAVSKEIGRAVEITNILKNIKEDILGGHVYIPQEFLQKAGIEDGVSAKEILTHKNLYIARQAMANIARNSFNEAYRLLEENHNKNSKPIVYMLNLYHAYFELMDNRGWEIISPKPELKFKDRCRLICKALFKSGH
ncbi:MAG: squalene/phytoene synthase family protein [Acetobacter sp.]|nr:squalene/phytoene synthase family protein [Acetobacter sp.]